MIDSEIIRKLGEVAKSVRLQSGLTTTEVATRMSQLGKKFSDGNLSRFERGDQGMTLERIPVLAEALGVTPSFLFRCAEQGSKVEKPVSIGSIDPLLKRIHKEVASNPPNKADETALKNVLEAQLHWLRTRERKHSY